MKKISLSKPIKILAVVGSPRKKGNTDVLVKQAAKAAESMGAEVTTIYLSKLQIKDCKACDKCAANMKCLLKDDMQNVYSLLEEAQAIIVGSPTYFYNVTGITKCFLDRLYAYEVFDPKNRHVWMGAMSNGICRFALSIVMGEQASKNDLGFASLALKETLTAIGYKMTDSLSFVDMVVKGDAEKNELALKEATAAGKRLVRACLLARKFYKD